MAKAEKKNKKKDKRDKKDKKDKKDEKAKAKKSGKALVEKKTKKQARPEKKPKPAKPAKADKRGNQPKGVTAATLSAGIRKGDRLADLRCVPCRGGVPPLGANEIKALLPKLRDWKAVDGHHLEREIMFPDFAQALDFAIEVGELAEVEQHHPDIYLAWGKVGIKIWTHKINGLTESDFVLAAKIDQLT